MSAVSARDLPNSVPRSAGYNGLSAAETTEIVRLTGCDPNVRP